MTQHALRRTSETCPVRPPPPRAARCTLASSTREGLAAAEIVWPGSHTAPRAGAGRLQVVQCADTEGSMTRGSAAATSSSRPTRSFGSRRFGRASATTSSSTASTSTSTPARCSSSSAPSGSGKSTLLRCVNLLEPLDSGRIFFEGEEITRKGADVSAVRQRIGIVFQQFNLFPHLTVLDNVTLAARRIRKLPPQGGRGTRARAARAGRARGEGRRSIRISSRAASSSGSRSRGR